MLFGEQEKKWVEERAKKSKMNDRKKKRIDKEQFESDIAVLKKQWHSIGLIVALLAIFKHKFHGLCTLRTLTGFPCPACGMTRAFILFLHGHIGESLRMHPLWPFVVLLGAFSLYRRYMVGGKSKCLEYLYYAYIIFLAVALFVLYFYRMYRYFPYQEPMIYYMDNVLVRIWKGR